MEMVNGYNSGAQSRGLWRHIQALVGDGVQRNKVGAPDCSRLSAGSRWESRVQLGAPELPLSLLTFLSCTHSPGLLSERGLTRIRAYGRIASVRHEGEVNGRIREEASNCIADCGLRIADLQTGDNGDNPDLESGIPNRDSLFSLFAPVQGSLPFLGQSASICGQFRIRLRLSVLRRRVFALDSSCQAPIVPNRVIFPEKEPNGVLEWWSIGSSHHSITPSFQSFGFRARGATLHPSLQPQNRVD
jgi:hypothetical protein